MKWQDRPQALIQLQKAISKAVRAEKRDRVEKLLTGTDEAKGVGATRIIYRTINSLAPKQQGTRETVWDAEGRAWFGEAEELDARAHASPSWPRRSRTRRKRLQLRIREHDRPRRPPRTSSTKNKCTSSKWGLPDKKRPDLEMGAGKCARRAVEAGGSTVQWITGPGAPRNYRDGEVVFLPKTGKNLRHARNGWRTINLLDHLGKAYSRGLIQPHMPEITSKMHRYQFGALRCRGTREEILFVNEVMERFRSMARHKKSSQRPLRKMAVLLFDLEKAFDCIPRDRACSRSWPNWRGRMISN